VSTYRISQVAQRTGVPATTLRFYEQAGLLPAARNASGYRLYDDASLERLAFITAAKGLGLPLEEIAELLGVWQDGACVDVRDTLRTLVTARLDQTRARIAELSTFTTQLEAALVQLSDMPPSSGPCDPDCAFLHPPEAPIACSLDAVDQGERASRWRDLLADGHPEPIADGVRVTLPADRGAALAELAVAEQRCCPFFDFQLQFAGDRVHLQVRAPAHAGELLTELF
jgi:MerR family copper efflux transcriptional regulator